MIINILVHSMYSYITNPITGKNISLQSKEGNNILYNYLIHNQLGDDNDPCNLNSKTKNTPCIKSDTRNHDICELKDRKCVIKKTISKKTLNNLALELKAKTSNQKKKGAGTAESGEEDGTENSQNWDLKLLDAVSEGNEELVASLLQNPMTDLNMTDEDGYTALMHAIDNGKASVVAQLLADKRLNPNKVDENGDTALMHVVKNTNTPVLTLAILTLLLADERVNPNITNKDGDTALMLAANNGKASVVAQLLADKRVNPTITDENSDTVLMYAAQNGHAKTKKNTLEYKNNNSKWELLKNKTNLKFLDVIDIYKKEIKNRIDILSTKNFHLINCKSTIVSGYFKIIDICFKKENEISNYWGNHCELVNDANHDFESMHERISLLNKYRLKKNKKNIFLDINKIVYCSFWLAKYYPGNNHAVDNNKTIHKDKFFRKIPGGYKVNDIVYIVNPIETYFSIGIKTYVSKFPIGHKAIVIASGGFNRDMLFLKLYPKTGEIFSKLRPVPVQFVSKSKPLIFEAFEKYKIISDAFGEHSCLKPGGYDYVSLQDLNDNQKISCVPYDKFQEYFVESFYNIPIYAYFQSLNIYDSIIKYILEQLDSKGNITGYSNYSHSVTLILSTETNDNFNFINQKCKDNQPLTIEECKDINTNIKIKFKLDNNMNKLIPCNIHINELNKTVIKYNDALLKLKSKKINVSDFQVVKDEALKYLTYHPITKCKSVVYKIAEGKKLPLFKYCFYTDTKSNSKHYYPSGEFEDNHHLCSFILDLLKDCETKYSKIIINLLIKANKIDHANFLIFHKIMSSDGSIAKDKDQNVIWEVYRFDPNGLFELGVDKYFKEVYFKPYTNIVYRGLIWEKIIELQKKGKIKNSLLGGNPSGTCALLSCYLVILSILNPMIPIDKITVYFLEKIRFSSIKSDNQKGHVCNMRFIEDKLTRYFLELFDKTNGDFIDFPKQVIEIVPHFQKIAKEITTNSILSKIYYKPDNSLEIANININ